MTNPRPLLRKQLRTARRALSPARQREASLLLMRQLRHWLPLIRCQHIALYLPNDGEIDPRPLMRVLERCGKSCYLPRLYANGQHRVWFVRYRSGDKLYKNCFGIPEPSLHNPVLPAWALQAVLMPLVGFDRQGNRLGMGGGFYDRSFAFRKERHNSRPLLIGLAHSIQEADSIPSDSWDIPLDVVSTEKSRYPVQAIPLGQ